MFRRLLIATLIGILAALAVAAFRHAMQLLEWIFLSNDTGSLVNAAEGLSPWRRLITPALGGLAAGLLLWGWQKMNQQRPHAPTDYMEALQTDGQFDVGASLVKSLASLLVVVSGSAIGREGAMILLAALAASSFARRFTPREEWKLWIASGAAAGMAGAYHAPLAGSLFIAEILFGTLMLASLGPVVVSAVVALLTSTIIFALSAAILADWRNFCVQNPGGARQQRVWRAGRRLYANIICRIINWNVSGSDMGILAARLG